MPQLPRSIKVVNVSGMNTIANTKTRVLIVDDEPANIKILSNLLAGDYALSVATNGKQALEVARVQSPDLILLDMVMPEMDGIEVCQALKLEEATKDIPVIFVTSMSDSFNEERGLDAGAVDYISKPISPPIVKARVKIHIQNYLSQKFLENLLSSQTTTLEDAKEGAKSLLVFV
jgi:putative two-component system response regulator